jgi:HK97 family phage portal protein
MGFFDRFKRAERASGENPRVPVSAGNFWEAFGMSGFGVSASGVNVTTEAALGVPAIWAAVNFLSGTLASLPLHLYRKGKAGNTRVNGRLATILHDAPNEEMTSFAWRKSVFDSVLTEGRAFTYIERNDADQVINLWPLDQSRMTVKNAGPTRIYEYQDTDRRTVRYKAAEVIDLAFMLKPDMVRHRGPIATNRDVVGMAIAATQYASRYFQGGGVPPFAIYGTFATPGATQRAADDMDASIREAAKWQRQALVLPKGIDIKPIGADPEKSQLIETHRFIIEQIARIYSLPPVFLQDLTRATFTNSEQQDLHLVKHTLLRWVEQFEQELNLKIFGRSSTVQYAEINVDGLLRGDFKTRMEGYASGIQHGILMPNEARQRENLPDDPKGDQLYMQGAMTPLGTPIASSTVSNGGQSNAS